ncbi:MAG: hypothetical protein RL536_184 [Candidatus Parcubacteria bacterium]|jgi:hypothetical protein
MTLKKSFETSLILPVTSEFIERRIYVVHGKKVMLDSDLAELYQVPTKALNQSVKRNTDRFPDDFMFSLTKSEVRLLNRSQFVTGSQKHRDPKYSTLAFTELGVAMLSSVLHSDRAVQMNIFIMRAFVKLRDIMISNKELTHRIELVENKQEKQRAHLIAISTALRKLADEPVKSRGPIGFRR